MFMQYAHLSASKSFNHSYNKSVIHMLMLCVFNLKYFDSEIDILIEGCYMFILCIEFK